MDRRVVLIAAVGLVSAFVCPLVVGPSWLFGPTLLTQAPPGLRMLALVPGIVGPLALLAALALRPLARSVLAMASGGVGIIALVGTLEALTAGQSSGLEQVFTRGVGLMPGPRALLLFSAALAAAFTGLAIGVQRPEAGRRIAGIAGAVALAAELAPLGGRTPLGIALDAIAWKTAWPVPLALIATAAFAATCAALLLEDWLPEAWTRARLTRLAALLGLVAIAALPVGLAIDAAARTPDLLATTITLTIKVYGAWIALYALVVGGILGLFPAVSAADAGPAAR